jgi:hypothetical protein
MEPETKPPEELLEEFLDNLSMTYLTATGILDALAKPEDIGQALSTESILVTKLRYSTAALSNEVGYILHQNHDGYLDLDFMRKTIFDELHPNPFQEALLEAITFRINLGLFAIQLWTWRNVPESVPETINFIDLRFPAQFLTRMYNETSPSASKLITETFNVALGIRTQTGIASYREREIRNPAEVFYMQDGEESLPRVWAGVTWHDEVEGISTRVQALQQILTDNNQLFETSVATLEVAFSLESFVIDTLEWIRRRDAECKLIITKGPTNGGIDGAIAILKAKAQA